ncbi:MAG: NAD(P)/FAD-dependent oxidoreductase [Lachnospiraceae bacterium]|nr:NAD(P)/FAD-dependent oxidoreductase [Lachnospiraceae bacterium]
MARILVVGGGAAGMMAAAVAAKKGHEVLLFEQNEKLGKKLYITGKGRCNLTNACDREELYKNVVTNPRFLYSAFAKFSNQETIAYFNSIGLATKIERGGRVFPVSDHSSDVIRVLGQELKRRGVKVLLGTKVKEIMDDNGCFALLVTEDEKKYFGDACILATGGLSYPTTGATGDGYRFASQLGHHVTELFPSLVSFKLKEPFPAELEGLSLKNIRVHLVADLWYGEEKSEIGQQGKKAGSKKKKRRPGEILFEDFGELVFTGTGISGPVVLSASSYAAPLFAECAMSFHIDLKPALSIDQLDARILRDFDEAKNKCLKNALDHLLPQKLIRVIIERSGISPDRQAGAIKKGERRQLAGLLKDLYFPVQACGGYAEAVITKGGIDVGEINPSTMESRLVKGIYFAGEVLDVDALTGGFNLQVAWSSGYLAGLSAAGKDFPVRNGILENEQK